jgi:ribosomal protein S18 acetylase RimI-like enzyme
VLRTSPELIVVAEVAGVVAGFCSYAIHDNEHGEIRNNAVDPEYQGRGIGHALHVRVLEIMREKGCKYAEVETGMDDAYARARGAYEKLGFEPYHYAVRYTMRLGGDWGGRSSC